MVGKVSTVSKNFELLMKLAMERLHELRARYSAEKILAVFKALPVKHSPLPFPLMMLGKRLMTQLSYGKVTSHVV